MLPLNEDQVRDVLALDPTEVLRLVKHGKLAMSVASEADANFISMAAMESWLKERVDAVVLKACEILHEDQLAFDSSLHGKLPDEQGVYVIAEHDADHGEYLRAGRTKTAKGGLRQRVYTNHFKGDQDGNICAQLVRDGRCEDVKDAQKFLRDRCHVRVMRVSDYRDRAWTEAAILSILRPRYMD